MNECAGVAVTAARTALIQAEASFDTIEITADRGAKLATHDRKRL